MNSDAVLQGHDMYDKYKDILSLKSRDFFSKKGYPDVVYQDLNGDIYECKYFGVRYKNDEQQAIQRLFSLIEVLVNLDSAKAYLIKPLMIQFDNSEKLLLVYLHLDNKGVNVVNTYLPSLIVEAGELIRECVD